MKVLVVVDGHLYRTPDGNVWAARIYSYDFFARYLSAFEKVRVAIRITDVSDNKEYPILCSGPNVEFCAIEEFKGPKEYILKYYKIQKEIDKFFDGCDCGIFRIPSTVGYQFLHSFQRSGKPYAIEVVVDPWDFASPGSLKTVLRPIIRIVWTKKLKSACLKANGVSYVTKFALQERYPSYARLHGENKKKYESYYSSVNISEDFFGVPKSHEDIHKPFRIVHITNLIGNYVKGHKELIEATAKLRTEGYNISVDFVGEGSLIEEFASYASSLGVGNQINFVGKLATPEMVRKKLIESDLFVFPSHAEGLPRVLIEAMAVGLPAISTNINGIPELLPKEFLVEVGDVLSLVEKIKRVVNSKDIYEKASVMNINKAKEYSNSVLQSRRKLFYEKLRNLC